MAPVAALQTRAQTQLCLMWGYLGMLVKWPSLLELWIPYLWKRKDISMVINKEHTEPTERIALLGSQFKSLITFSHFGVSNLFVSFCQEKLMWAAGSCSFYVGKIRRKACSLCEPRVAHPSCLPPVHHSCLLPTCQSHLPLPHSLSCPCTTMLSAALPNCPHASPLPFPKSCPCQHLHLLRWK